MSRVNYQTASGNPLLLGPEIGRGGEGVVFSIENTPNCAKIYHQPLEQDRADKIRLMAANRNQSLTAFSSWPIELIKTATGQSIGLVMPKIQGMRDVHELYSPKSRRDKFPRANWRFLVAASANIARAFAAIHESGVVIGDVNHGSILVGQDARVKLVDTDSFQAVFDGKTYLCEKGVETYTPPELQSKSFAGVVRTKDHDNFGLAVLIFHLLMMGRHPFAGRFSGAGEMPIPRAIAERRFAYGSNRSKVLMERPPGTPDLSILGAEVTSLMETAFTSSEAGRRPTARAWIGALSSLEAGLSQCALTEGHWYLKQQAGCPWCQMEKATGTPLFPFVVQQTTGLDVPALVKMVSGLVSLGTVPDIPEPTLSPSNIAVEARSERIKLVVASILFGLAAAGCGFVFGGIFLALAGAGLALGTYKVILMSDKSLERQKEAVEQAQAAWTSENRQWTRQASGAAFEQLRSSFFSSKAELDRLPLQRRQRMDQLQKDRYRLQLETYLDRFSIEHAAIPGIGLGRKVALASEGIETAADVIEQKLYIPGFGPATRGRLIDWRRGVEKTFVFDATRPVDQTHIAAVEQWSISERIRLENVLKEKCSAAVQEHARIQATRSTMQPRIEANLHTLTQARVDLKHLSSM